MRRHEAVGVPDLVAEVAVPFDAFDRELDVAPLPRQRGQREAQRVGTEPGKAVRVLPLDALQGRGRRPARLGTGQEILRRRAVDHVQGINDVPPGLGHLLALLVPDQPVDHHVSEGHVSHEAEPQHDHPGHPEEQDIEPGDQARRRIVHAQRLGLLGPAERREWPESGAEPGVQHIRLLAQRPATARAARRRRPGNHRLAAGIAVPRRNPVTPPDLPRDAPVPDVPHPLEIGLLPLAGDDPDLARLDRPDGGLGQGRHLDEPLARQRRLDHRLAAVAVPDRVAVILDLHQELFALELLDQAFAAGEAILSRVRSCVLVHAAVVGDHFDLREIVAQAALEILGIVRRGHLDETGPELAVHVRIGDDRDLPTHDGQQHPPALQPCKALVLGVDRHRRVAQHRLRPRRRHHHLAPAVHEGIPDVPQLPVPLLVLHLQIRERRLAAGAPVDDIVPAVDQPALIELAEDLLHRLRQPGVQREPLAGPVAGRAQRPELADDGPARLALPRPDALHERLTAELVPREPLLPELPLHHVLRGDAGMIRTGHPEGVVPAHPMPADQDILQRVVQGVPHMERARHVGRRDDDAVRGGRGGLVGAEEILLLPGTVPARLHPFGIVPLLCPAPRPRAAPPPAGAWDRAVRSSRTPKMRRGRRPGRAQHPQDRSRRARRTSLPRPGGGSARSPW